MISIAKTKKVNLLFALTVSVILPIGFTQQASALPTNSTACKFSLILATGIPSFIRLYTKGTPKGMKFKTKIDDPWENKLCDFFEILKVWNLIFHPYKYLKLVDKRWVGTPLKVLKTETTTKTPDGLKEELTHDSKLELLPTGVCGTIDCYVLKQLKKLYDAIGNIEKALIVYCLLHDYDIEKLADVWLNEAKNIKKA